MQNHLLNPLKSSNLKKYIDLVVWDVETTFGLLGMKDLSSHKSIHKLQFSQIRPHFIQNQKLNPIN